MPSTIECHGSAGSVDVVNTTKSARSRKDADQMPALQARAAHFWRVGAGHHQDPGPAHGLRALPHRRHANQLMQQR